MKIRIHKLIALFSVIALFSCDDMQQLPGRPRIEYRSFSIFDTTDILGNSVKGGRLNFYFEDGDGDLGLPTPSDNLAGDSINLFLKLYRLDNGVITPAPGNDPLTPIGFRIPYMTRTGVNRILKGNISVVFLYLFYTTEDSIRYDFFIKDRAENISNVVSTDTIPIFYNGNYEDPS
jgi:hypothetical protein